jgi:hypothetical protein
MELGRAEAVEPQLDNLPNPYQLAASYMPVNGPAIGDLTNLFNFAKFRPNAPSINPVVSDLDKNDHD